MQPMRIAEELASREIDRIGGGIELGSLRRLGSNTPTNFVTDASIGVTNAFDTAALRPRIDYARPDRPADVGAQIWIAAVALSLSLHAAGLIAVLVWPKPPPAPPDSTPIEIIVEAAPADASSPLKLERAPAPEDTLPTSPSPIAPPVAERVAPAVATPVPVPELLAAPAPVPVAPPTAVDQTAPDMATPAPPPAPSATPAPSPVAPPPVVGQATPEILAPAPPPAPPPAPSPVAPPPVVEEAVPEIVTPPPALSATAAPNSVAPQPVVEEATPEIVAPAPPSPSVARPPVPPIAVPVRAHVSAPIQQPKLHTEPPRKTEAHAPIQTSPAEPKPMKAAPGAARVSSLTVSGAEISEYQSAVIARLSAAKRYPDAARDRAPHGTAIVRFTIDASGQVAGASLAQSAGDAILDAEALATVRRASPFPPPPTGAPRAFSAPLSFRVR
jgi:periplasmic protein TonB